MLLSLTVNAEIIYEQSLEGDFYAYIPVQTPKNILVIAHGMIPKKIMMQQISQSYTFLAGYVTQTNIIYC